MFKHILLPTDGSKLAARAIARGIGLGKSLGARLTLLSVVPEFRMVADESFAVPMSAELKKTIRGRSQATCGKNAVGNPETCDK